MTEEEFTEEALLNALKELGLEYVDEYDQLDGTVFIYEKDNLHIEISYIYSEEE